MTGQEFPTPDATPTPGAAPAAAAGTVGLLPSVVQALAEAGLTETEYVSQFSADGLWYGDECGCSDDRCIGFHHDAGSDCGCFPVLLDQALDTLAAQASAVAAPESEFGEAGL